MLRGDGESVEKHQDDDQPIKRHRFHSCTTLPAAETVPPSPLTTDRQINTYSEEFSSKISLNKPQYKLLLEISLIYSYMFGDMK